MEIKFDTCPHLNIVGDNNGMTCQDCGAQVGGYGYGGDGDGTCRHEYIKVGDGAELVCVYCERGAHAVETCARRTERMKQN